MSDQIKALKTQKDQLFDEQQRMLNTHFESKTKMSDGDEATFENIKSKIKDIDQTIARFEAVAAGKRELAAPVNSPIIAPGVHNVGAKFYAMGGTHTANRFTQVDPISLSSDYAKGMWASLKNGKAGFDRYCFDNAVLGEGGTSADGSALVPISTDPSIPNLAPYECSARKLSRVITTENDLNIPYQSAKGVAALKAETNNGNTNAFTASVAQFATTKLSAYMIGVQVGVSWELLQDSKALAAFVTAEIQRNIVAAEENYFINGTGSSQAQGYLASGVASVPTGSTISSGVASIASNGIKPLLETQASLNPVYYGNASWLTHRQEFVRLQEAQLATSQFQTYVTWDPNGNARLLGHPVLFSYEMGVYAASPSTDGDWLFGDFNAFATLGDRGDSNIRIKVLDQVAAQNGQTVILGYRRSDQRVVLGEAVYLLQTNG
jgi:HK97 family phage major capsid protein